jgi:hypothetical protein
MSNKESELTVEWTELSRHSREVLHLNVSSVYSLTLWALVVLFGLSRHLPIITSNGAKDPSWGQVPLIGHRSNTLFISLIIHTIDVL